MRFRLSMLGGLAALAAGSAGAQDIWSESWPFATALSICTEAGRDLRAGAAALHERGYFVDPVAGLGPFQRHLGGFGFGDELETHVSISEHLHATWRLVNCSYQVLGYEGTVDLATEAAGLRGRVEADALGTYGSWEFTEGDAVALVQVTHLAGDFHFRLRWIEAVDAEQ